MDDEYEGDDEIEFEQDDDMEGGEWPWVEQNNDPSYQPTPRPTHHAYTSPTDDILESTTVGEFDDDVKNGLELTEEKVQDYLNEVESPQEMEQDKNVQVAAGVLTVVFVALWLITAHQTMENPDGLCAR
jgi:hypothetical protein